MGITTKIVVLSVLAILLAAGIAFGIYKKTGQIDIFAQEPSDIFFPDDNTVAIGQQTIPETIITTQPEAPTSIPEASGVDQAKSKLPKLSWLIIAPIIIACLFLYVAKKFYG